MKIKFTQTAMGHKNLSLQLLKPGRFDCNTD